MKKAGKVTLKDAVTLSESEMRNVVGGSGLFPDRPIGGSCTGGYQLWQCGSEYICSIGMPSSGCDDWDDSGWEWTGGQRVPEDGGSGTSGTSGDSGFSGSGY